MQGRVRHSAPPRVSVADGVAMRFLGCWNVVDGLILRFELVELELYRVPSRSYAWWVLPSGDGDRRLAGQRRDENDRQRDSLKAQWACASIENAGGNEACRLVLRHEPDWKSVLAQLDSLRAWSLPDQDSVTKVDSLFHGAIERRPSENMMVTVEALDGADYRTYSYTNARTMPADEARRAAVIVTMINELASLARRPEKATPPRGP